MAEFSFDIVSAVDLAEVKNALQQVDRELAGRFDFRNSKTSVTLEGETIRVISDDEFHLNMVLDIVRSKLAKREVSLKALEYSKIEAASGGTVRQIITLRQGIPTEEAKALVKQIKATGIKAQAQMQGDQLRVTGKDKDSLQAVQKFVRSLEDLSYDVQFVNYR